MQRLLAVRDVKVGAYQRVYGVNHLVDFERELVDVVNNPKTMFYKFPGDYQLHEVGQWDEQTGKLVAFDEPVFLREISEFKQEVPRADGKEKSEA